MNTSTSECSVCGKGFEVRFRYQVREEGSAFVYVCSQSCHAQTMCLDEEQTCSVCHRGFTVEFPHQVTADDRGRAYYCSTDCRQRGLARAHHVVGTGPRRIAVFNHKGGTGKTTTAVNLAAGLAEVGYRVLLVDADGQGNVGASLGISGELTLYHALVLGADVDECAVPVRQNLDVITSDETLAAAELYLAGRPNRARVLRERLGARAAGYDMVVLDCAPALSVMNQNALVYADSVLVPVACDYLSIIGVRQVLKTLKSVRQHLGHAVDLLGVLPTFFDVRNRISRQAVSILEEHFGDRCLPPIRINTRLREAPSVRQTIFEFSPQSHGAQDYLDLVTYIAGLAKQADLGKVALPGRNATEGVQQHA